MQLAQLEIQLIAALTAVACALPGVFLVLRRLALISDAISHTVLLGIVLGFLIPHWLGNLLGLSLTVSLSSPLLIVGAALTGMLTVSLVELLHRGGRVSEDTAIGLVFTMLFSLAVVLVSRHARSIHLDTDAVLLGELAYAPLRRLVVADLDLGPRALWVMGIIAALNLAFIVTFYKELKLATFDTGLAAALGFAPGLLHYALMALVSVTAVGAFDAVGSILVVALMVGPPATAYLLTDRLSGMLLWSVAFGVAAAVMGYWLADWLDVSIAGAMATMTGVLFGLVLVAAPEQGLVALWRRRARQRREFYLAMLAIHLFNHEGRPEAAVECRVEHLQEHLRWPAALAEWVVSQAERKGLVRVRGGQLALTDDGRRLAQRALVG